MLVEYQDERSGSSSMTNTRDVGSSGSNLFIRLSKYAVWYEPKKRQCNVLHVVYHMGDMALFFSICKFIHLMACTSAR